MPTNATSLYASPIDLAQTLGFTLVDDLIMIILSSVLFGVLMMLIAASTYILISHGLRRLSVRLLLACTVVLFISSSVYWATLLEYAINTSKLLASAVNVLGNSSSSAVSPVGLSEAARACILTATFTVNVCIGDAVVWWRARMLYPGNKKVRHVCCILLSSTFALGIVSTRRSVFVQDSAPGSIPIVYNGDPFGTAAVALSLATNVFSTALIAYKSWQHRQFLREHLGAGGSSTQVLKIMALLVESGMMYSLIWVEFLVYHVISNAMPGVQGGAAWSFYHEACLAPIVAIYPMVIVVLVALNQSQLEAGLTRSQAVAAARTLSTWAVASRANPHTTSTRVFTYSTSSNTREGSGGGGSGCPFSSVGTRVGDIEGAPGLRGSVVDSDEDPFGPGKVDGDEKMEMDVISVPTQPQTRGR